MPKNPQNVKRMERYEYSSSRDSVERLVRLTDGQEVSTRINIDTVDLDGRDAHSMFDYAFLRERSSPIEPNTSEAVRVADLFCGCGGLSLGAKEACRAMGKRFLSVAAVDNDPCSTDVYRRNFPKSKTYLTDITHILSSTLGSAISPRERHIGEDVQKVDVLLAGPPCQGYSDLNNRTRRRDPRNSLYEYVVRFAEVTRPKHVLIENVSTVIHGRERAVQTSVDAMRDMGYSVDSGIVDLSELGVPQTRRRHVVVASESRGVTVRSVLARYRVDRERPVRWAIEDLEDEPQDGIFTTSTRHTETNKRRIRYLHENDVYELPNRLRPPCHRDGNHSYKSMYGRIRMDEPAQTVTRGFGSPGQGRFVHPTQMRTLTPHEAARLQFFPDFFDFSLVQKRVSLAGMIGNAAPMKLSYVFCLDLLG